MSEINDFVKPPSLHQWREIRDQEETRILNGLPDVADRQFTLLWELEAKDDGDPEERFWVIKHGTQEIYREKAGHEDYHRFELLARLLKQKYGSRIKDLIPAETGDTGFYLYGDYLGAVRRVEAARKRSFGVG
ncbi:MAG TPA: hypothetical protein VFA76_09240 [Terriglobales bacterium]|nr:hypothetical protein [Terriglobales bacterium]